MRLRPVKALWLTRDLFQTFEKICHLVFLRFLDGDTKLIIKSLLPDSGQFSLGRILKNNHSLEATILSNPGVTGHLGRVQWHPRGWRRLRSHGRHHLNLNLNLCEVWHMGVPHNEYSEVPAVDILNG